MSELGKVEERLGIGMGAYLLPCKAETGVRPDTLPQELRECTPVEIVQRSRKQEEAIGLVR